MTDLLLKLVEVVDDDTDEQIQNEERARHDERHKVGIGRHVVLAYRLTVDLQSKTYRLDRLAVMTRPREAQDDR